MEHLTAIRSHINAMPAYHPVLPCEVLAAQTGIPVENLVKLDANENPYGPLPEVRQVLARLPNLHIYPDPESRRIRALLAQHHDIPPESILMGAGADELISLIVRLVIDPGDRMVICPPTFGMYAFEAGLQQAEQVVVPRREDFSLDLPQILKAVRNTHPKLIFLAHPNNPDGGLVAEGAVRVLLELPLLVVMDEAYINFSAGTPSWIDEVGRHRNLIVLRTFSKWAGLAGLRAGYGVFPLPIAEALRKTKPPYNLSVAAEEAACVTLQHMRAAEARVARIVAERKRLFQALKTIPWLELFPSQANFILCRVLGKDARRLHSRLRELGILVRYFDKPGLRGFIRISTGRPEDSDRLLAALQAMEVL